MPTHVRILPGRREKNSAAPKNTTEKPSSQSFKFAVSGITCSRPTVNETVAQRGIAKNGPMVI